MSEPRPTATVARYDALAILFHWLTAILIGAVYALGQLRFIGGRGSALMHWMESTHYALGIAVGCCSPPEHRSHADRLVIHGDSPLHAQLASRPFRAVMWRRSRWVRGYPVGSTSHRDLPRRPISPCP